MADNGDFDIPPLPEGLTARRPVGGASNAGAAARPMSRAERPISDPVTLFGILGALVLMITAIALGGSPLAFLDLPSILIVLGGTLALTLASFGLPELLATGPVIWRTALYRRPDPDEAARGMLELAERARQQGILKLQGPTLEALKSTPFLHKGIGLVIDGVEESEIEDMLHAELAATVADRRQAAQVLRKGAEVAPAMGLIGTLIGLVQMLGRLEDPSTIGPAMALALLTTFYGACLANLVLAPLASKLELNAADEQLTMSLQLIGVLSINRQDNPRRLEMQVNSLLPPGRRIQFFD
ncbi:motility protein A [Roseospirillum parvum]|uniref:Chemotaxis protein MotA n=1 Tax=Roseospirillum parvum TaxID=83401 RepID=A0A1G7W970_9PROT|nr:MotA/TolQ/ExbB proton channel family protein [Roseospirillum parvum]SDG68524.1 chemotaxis protein MotA [Roseospirillum parvum]